MSTQVVLVTIEPGNVIKATDVVRAEPGDKIMFMVENNDNVDHYVWVDAGEIIQRQDKGATNPPRTNPCTTGKVWKKVNAAGAAGDKDVDHFIHKIRPKADFGNAANQIPYTTYKYTIRSGTTGQNDPHAAFLDPDIDVITP